MPTVLRQDGFRFFFYSKEGNEPPHIHVIGRGGEMKLWIDPIAVDKIFRLNPKDQKDVLSIVIENKDYLLKCWEEFYGTSSQSN